MQAAKGMDPEALHHNGHHGGIELDVPSLSDSHELDDGAEDEPFEVGEDDPKPAQRTSIIEQCLAYGSEQRLRLQLTLSVTGELPFHHRTQKLPILSMEIGAV